MRFFEVLTRVIELLQNEGRVSYRAIKREWEVDDEFLDDLKMELIEVRQVAVDQEGKMLIWAGDATSPSATAPTQEPSRPPVAYTPTYLAEKIRHAINTLAGERKQVTVLFADIKDSTELIKDLDPEAAQQLIDPAIHIMMEAVHRYEGTVNQVLGDGIMALFGAPIAHEDHALRACYAALAMQTAMRAYTEQVRRTHGLTMRIRVGLNAGEVVVRTIGNDLHMDYSAVGPTTNLASRMEQLADPGGILLTAATLQLVEGLVRVQEVGLVPVKGVTAPVEVYELVGVSAIRRRLQTAIIRGLTRFVGRDKEMDALTRVLEQVGTGHGQVVAVVGEAGVGKSRLTYEFIHSHRTKDWRILESAAMSYSTATPYFAIVDLLKRYAHVEDRDEPRTIRAKVTGQVLTLDETLHDLIPALLALLDVLPEDDAFLTLDPPQRRRRTLEALKRLLMRESQVQPVLLVLEDLHWIDSETQALLDNLVESLPNTPLLLLANYRPEYRHSWRDRAYYTQIRLDPLSPTSAEAFLQALLGNDPSLEPLKRLLIERTEGNPFFLEESVRTLAETQVLLGEPGTYRLVRELPTVQVPATVQAILAARIDRLSPEEKQLLQTASVIGTEVPLALLHAITDLSEDTLHQGLAHLQTAEFLYEASLFPERVYAFKHTLTHEVAYGSLLQERRRLLHAQILECLEISTNDRPAEQVERLANHAFRGEVWDKALTYFQQAGTMATARSASREAVVCFEQALTAIRHLPEHRDLRERAIDLRLALRSARIVLGDLEGTFNDLHEAETLANTLDDPHRLGRISLYLALNFCIIGNYEQAALFAKRALDLAMISQEIGFQAQANNYLAVLSYAQGAYNRGMDYCRQAMALLKDDLLYERFGEAAIPSVLSRDILALCLASVGAFAEGIAIGKEGVQIAETVAHPASYALASRAVAMVYLRQGEVHQAVPMLERAVATCRETDLVLYFSDIAMTLGAAYTRCSRVKEAVPLLEEAVKQATAIGRMQLRSFCVAALSDAYLQTGNLETAGPLAERALELARTCKERGNEAYILLLLGNIAVRRDPPDCEQANVYYQQAFDLANELSMRPLQAHCHRDLGTLYAQTGNPEQARAELSAASELYRSMEMAFWLPETEATLAQIEK